MQTTAGSWLLDGSIVPRDAGVVSRLREAGAVILGKANMTEWANWCAGGVMPDGWSGRGGQTKNPFGGTTSGSSSGSAVCATANFATVTLGTETDGSIVSPSCLMSVVGLKPTVGLTSRSGVIPISGSQDSVGPITRCVEDAAVLLDVICGVDEFDLKTRDADGKRPGVSYTSFLKSGGGALDGIQIGFDASMADEACFASVDVFKKLGATVVDVVFPDVDQGTTRTVFSYEFKAGIKDYLGQLENCPYKTLEDLIVANAKDSREGNWGTHDWDCSVEDLDDPVYRDAIDLQLKSARENGLDKFFKENQLDAFVGKPTDFDNVCLDMAHAAAMSGYPVMTVSAPGDKTIPSAIGLIGLAWSEPTLLQIGYAYEQETHGRVVPMLP
ncbi:hypothetical protein HDU79_001019 [Rhizoclosmatium sp. JEL0117]|nr:hypothetical protein HDU79_001019 [Rhizoclosmatium sp. JEL0117]